MNRKITFVLGCFCFIYLISLASLPCPTCDTRVEVTHVAVYDSPPSLDRPVGDCIRARDLRGLWKVETFVACASIPPKQKDVSVLVQLTLDRVDTLVDLVDRWRGPMSVVFYLPFDNYYISELIRLHGLHENLKKFADFHVVYVEEKLQYPVNHLRNVALLNARTEFVLTLDVDFIPNPDMHSQLKLAVGDLSETKKELFVIAALEAKDNQFPSTKRELVDLYKSGKAYQVHYYKGRHAHSPTNYEKWYESDTSYEVEYEYSYEPYVVLRKKLCPFFDERFIGYGNDKSSHSYELAVAGFNFIVLPEPFIIHKDHPSPAWRVDQGSSDSWQRWVDFTRSLQFKYGNVVEVPQWLKDACNQGDCPQFWLFF